MFCPKCKSEYRDGFTVCSDCGIQLINELPAEVEDSKKEPEYADFVFVLATFSQGDVALIKSIFDKENIAYYIENEFGGTFIGGLPMRINVRKEDVEVAKELLKDIKISYIAF
jgi:hypothetical protein